MITPTHTLPDWHLIRALLLNELDAYPPDLRPSDSSIHLHTYLLMQQRWVIGQAALNPDGLPISSSILSLTLDGLDWASLLENETALTLALLVFEQTEIRPSTTLLREILLANQRDEIKARTHPGLMEVRTPKPPPALDLITEPDPETTPELSPSEPPKPQPSTPQARTKKK